MDAIVSFPRRLAYAWRRHGWRLFGPLLWHNVVYAIGRLRGTRGKSSASEVDRRFGIETHRLEATALMSLDGDNGLHGHGYQPVDAGPFRAIMNLLDVDHARYTFVDYGSGKGRALLLATEFAFPRIIGVEYAREIHDIAVRNIARAGEADPAAKRIECVWADATRYVPPAGPLVCFLYNPFDGVLMGRLIEHLDRATREMPRDILLAYLHPVHRDVVDSHPAVELVSSTDTMAIYRFRDASPP